MKKLYSYFKDLSLFYEKHKSSIHILITLCLLFVSIFVFVHQSVQLNKPEIWFSNMDADSTMLVESMRINSGKEPQFKLLPALGTYYIYSKFLKFFEVMNIIPISEFNQLASSEDPLMLLPEIFYKGRTISIIIAILCALIFGSIFYLLTEKLLFFLISTVLYLFSGGLFLHSLLIRTELTSVFFVLLSWLLLIMYSKARSPSFLTIILAGVLFGFGVLTKIQVLPMIMFMIILLIYIVVKKLKKYPEGLLKHGINQFFFMIIILSTYIYFLNLIYYVYLGSRNSASIPLLLIIYILVILSSSMLSLLLWRKGRKISLFLSHMNLFLIGFLASFLIAFYLTNISTDNGMRSIFDLVFQSGSQVSEIKVYLHSMHEGILGVFAGFINFLTYYSLKSYLLVFLFLFLLLTIKRIDYKAIVTFAFGMGYWFFSSLRHFGPHYLIYSDIFLYTTLMLILAQFLSTGPKNNKFKKHLIKIPTAKYLLVVFMVFFMGQSQLNYVKREYPKFNEDYRNLADLIPYCSPWPGNEDYSNLMKNRYKNEIYLIDRVHSDPYLNGSKNGIDLAKKINYNIYGWLALYDKPDIKYRTKYKVKYEDIINRAMLTLLKNIYQSDKEKFYGIKEEIFKKGLGWSDEDVERRIIREIPSTLINLRLNNEVEFLGYDLAPITKSNLELPKNEKNSNQTELKFDNNMKNRLAKDFSILKLGEEFELIFYWKCLEIIDHRYAIWAALDKGYDSIELGHILVYENEYPTTAWKPGEVIKDICRFRVPDYVDIGEYALKISLFDLDERKQITLSIDVANIKILSPLEGSIRRGREYNKLGYRMKALDEYLEIIKYTDDILNPDNERVLLQALKKLETYRIKDPQNVDINYVIGIGYEKLGNLKDAEEMLQTVIAKEANHSEALFYLGKIYYLEKDYQLAADFLKKIPLDKENNFEAGLLLREVYNKLGDAEKVSEIEEKLQSISENSIKKSKWDVKGILSSAPTLTWANVNISKKLIFYGEPIKLALKIKGELAEGVLPHLTIWLDDRLLHEGYLNDEEWNIYEFIVKDIEPGEHLLKIWKRGGGPLYLSQ